MTRMKQMGADYFDQEALEGVSKNPIRLLRNQEERNKIHPFLAS